MILVPTGGRVAAETDVAAATQPNITNAQTTREALIAGTRIKLSIDMAEFIERATVANRSVGVLSGKPDSRVRIS